MAQIFISYSKQDIAFAKHLRALLQQAGFDVWMDERLVPSTQWWRMLEQQIKASTAFIVIMSPSSAESRWVEREILVAENTNIAIFPILLEGGGWSRLADIEYEDFTAGLKATLPQRFVEALRAVVDGRTTVNPISRPNRTPKTQTESRLLESAMPAETKIGADTEMWAKISLPDSPGLRAELPATVPSGDVIQKGDARTTSFPFRFPTDPRTGEKLPAHLTMKASSADFIIRSPGGDDQEEIELPPDADSRTVIFSLQHRQGGRLTGRARIFLDLIYDNRVIAQISVSTQLVEQVSRLQDGVSPWGLWSVPVGTTPASAGGYQSLSAPSAIPGSAAVLEGELHAALGGGMQEEADYDEANLDDYTSTETAAPVEQAFGRTESKKEAAPEAAPEDWMGALPSEPFPQPTPRQSASRSERAPAKPQSPINPVQRRAARFPAAAATVAAFALVFVVVIFVLSRQEAYLPGSVETAASATNLIVADATQTSEVSVANTETSETSSPTDLPVIQTTLIPMSNARNGIGVTLLYTCEGGAAGALGSLMDTLQIDHELLEGDVAAVVGDQASLDDGKALIFWGTCMSPDGSGKVSLFAELMGPPRVYGLLHPATLELIFPFDQLRDPGSAAADFLRAMSHYIGGQFDDELLNEFSHVLDAVKDDPANATGVIGLELLLGNIHLLNGDNYEAALSQYLHIDSDSAAAALNPAVAAAALNNAGLAELNHAFSLGDASADFDSAVSNASAYLKSALSSAAMASQQDVILLNQAALNYFVVPALDDNLSTAQAQCRQVRDEVANTTCLAAARLTALQNSDGVCSTADELVSLSEQIDEAVARDAGSAAYPYADFWKGRLYQAMADCAAADDDRQYHADLAHTAYASFLEKMTHVAAPLATDRAMVAIAQANE